MAYSSGRAFRLIHQNWESETVTEKDRFFTMGVFKESSGRKINVTQVGGRATSYRPDRLL